MSGDGPRSREVRIAAVVLAAGRSRRMPGRTKLVRRFRRRPVIRVVASTALEAGLTPVVVSVGPAADAICRALDGLPVHIEPVHDPARGRAVSAAAGLSVLGDPDVGAAMLLLGDEPGLEPSAIHSVRDAWETGAGDLLRARYPDRPGHPVLVARALFDRAASLALDASAGGGLWDRLTRDGVPGVEVPVGGEAPIDVDSPADLAAARSKNT